MTTVTDIVSQAGTRPVFMCDFSPPKDPATNWLDDLLSLNSDLVCIPHLAPHPTRPDAITTAHLIREKTDAEVAFNFATRDATKAETLERLENAHALGLKNVVVLQGDANRGVGNLSHEIRYKPSELIHELKSRGDHFCVGAVADLAKGVKQETNLSHRKIDAGADFLIVQPTFNIKAAEQFSACIGTLVPVFYGVQVLIKDGIVFTPVPKPLCLDIENGRSGVDAASELISRFSRLGITCFYLIAPICPGGARDYGMARQVMASFSPGTAPGSPV